MRTAHVALALAKELTKFHKPRIISYLYKQLPIARRALRPPANKEPSVLLSSECVLVGVLPVPPAPWCCIR